jgi:hypothetical protein
MKRVFAAVLSAAACVVASTPGFGGGLGHRGTCAATRHQRAGGAQPVRRGYVGAPVVQRPCWALLAASFVFATTSPLDAKSWLSQAVPNIR